jgi:indole-3-glycerol phosphate synthase
MEGLSLPALEQKIARAGPPKPFATALRGPHIRLIAEVKRASPTKGLIRPDLDAATMAQEYSANGAAAISVLTQDEHFGGSLADLVAVRQAVDLPVLRKDFIVEPYQVYEARAYGADAALLIVAILTPTQLKELVRLAHALGLTALVETHTAREVEEALAADAPVVGINNRNLRDFSVDLSTTLQLRPLIPSEVITVSESGIRTPEDVRLLREAGVDAVLVGEALVASANPGARIRELLAW